jgi:hypothetical protein
MPTELVAPDRSTVAPMLYGALAAVVCDPEPDEAEEPEEEQADKARAETAATARAAVGMRL